MNRLLGAFHAVTDRDVPEEDHVIGDAEQGTWIASSGSPP